VTPASASIVVVGSLNADLVVSVDRFPAPGETLTGRRFEVFPGGKGGNQACAASTLGASVAMVGQVGGDEHGAWLRSSLMSAKVDTALVRVDRSASSGVAVITCDRAGENEIVIVAGANGTFTPDRLDGALGVIREADVVLLQLEIPLETVIRAASEARQGGAHVLLDPAPARPVPDELLALATLITPNETELAAMTGGTFGLDAVDARARQLLRRGAGGVLAKLGPRGARLVTTAVAVEQPALSVPAVDSTAAGDAFNGALAVAMAEGRSPEEALPFATAAAAVSVTRAGAQPSMPTRGEVEALLQRSGS
jgi:ribokinase